MAENNIVSVIMPCYNSASVIAQSIESVIVQTYRHWELIIVDDCSSDNSADIVKSYMKKESRIKYFKTENRSGSPSLPRNIGIEKSVGSYIAFLDSDDIWLPSKLEEQIHYMNANRLEFVYSDYEKITNEGYRSNRIIRVKSATSYWDILESCSIPCLTVLLRKEIVGEIRFKSVFKEDYVFWMSILRKGIVAYNTNLVHALYRESKKSRSSDKLKMFVNQWDVLRDVEGVKLVPAIYFICIYAIKGLIKYLK